MGRNRVDSLNDFDRHHYRYHYSCFEIGVFIGVVVTYLMVVLSIITISYYSFIFENPPVAFYNIPFPTDKQVYRAGDSLIVTAEYCRYTDDPFNLSLQFENSIIVQVPEQVRSGTEKGCRTVNNVILQIPAHLPPGEWFVRAKAIYEVGPLGSQRTVSWKTKPFKVVK